MMLVYILIVNMVTDVMTGIIDASTSNLVHISRDGWKARQPKDRSDLKVPVPYVVIHHSFVPPVCENQVECAYAMRTMQSMHMDENKWSDIGYNFAVGGDGVVYDGRGWTTLGAHSIYFNDVSIGICLIGNFNDTLPSKNMLDATKLLIEEGVRLGHLQEQYKVIGHRQVRPTECPGQTLLEEIKNWPHYDPDDHSQNYQKKQQKNLE